MKTRAPLMRQRRVVRIAAPEYPFPHTSPLPSRKLDRPATPLPNPLHELDAIDVEPATGSQLDDDGIDDSGIPSASRGGGGFGSEPIQRSSTEESDSDEKTKKKGRRKRNRKSRERNPTKKDDESVNTKRKERDSSRERSRTKLKREGSNNTVKRTPTKKKSVKKNSDDDENDLWDPKYFNMRTGQPRKNPQKEKKPTLTDLFPEMKKSRIMEVPEKHDFYDTFFARPQTGTLLQNLSEQAMDEYENLLTGVVTTRNLKEQSQYISESFHKEEVEEPEKYYDTSFDEQALSLNELKKIVKTPKKKRGTNKKGSVKKKNDEEEEKKEIAPKESSTLWRQPVPGIRFQPKGSFVTSFASDDDYDSITKTLQGGIDKEEITPMELGTALNKPTPKEVREYLESIEKLKKTKRLKRDNYSKSEEMPKTMNDIYNLAYTDRAVEQQRNKSIGPFLGPRNTQISNRSIKLQDAFGKKGKSGMITYKGSGTNAKKEKQMTNELIGHSQSHIELQNLRDTELGEKSRRMVGTSRNLKKRGMAARNLAKAHGKRLKMELRENTPEPPSYKEAEKEYKYQLMLDYGSINNRDVQRNNSGKLTLKNEGHEDSFSEDEVEPKLEIKKRDDTPKKIIPIVKKNDNKTKNSSRNSRKKKEKK